MATITRKDENVLVKKAIKPKSPSWGDDPDKDFDLAAFCKDFEEELAAMPKKNSNTPDLSAKKEKTPVEEAPCIEEEISDETVALYFSRLANSKKNNGNNTPIMNNPVKKINKEHFSEPEIQDLMQNGFTLYRKKEKTAKTAPKQHHYDDDAPAHAHAPAAIVPSAAQYKLICEFLEDCDGRDY
jgi:hypothetical protein